MTLGADSIPFLLRPVVLAARMTGMAEVTPPMVARVLAAFTPPIDPASPQWAALCAALSHFDSVGRDQAALDAAREQVITAAVDLLADQLHCGVISAPVSRRLPGQRRPPMTGETA